MDVPLTFDNQKIKIVILLYRAFFLVRYLSLNEQNLIVNTI